MIKLPSSSRSVSGWSVPGLPRALLALAILLTLAAPALAQVDGLVRSDKLSHCDFTDRRPICPLNGESFDILFQAARGDLSGARVGVDEASDGVGITWIPARLDSSRGQFDIWRATIPASPSGKLSYVIAADDGPTAFYLSTIGTSNAQPALNFWWKIDASTLEHAPVGSTPTASGTVFKVWAPNATSCLIRGTFNAWGSTTSLTKRGEYFVGLVPAARAGDSYKYYFNNNLWKSDPRGKRIDNANNYNTLVHDPLAYQWRTPAFAPAPRDRWVVYQLHVGSFSGLNDPVASFTRQGTYRDVGLRAAHLAELGVNCVMLNPVNEFPGAASGGYNPITAFGFESTYGTPDDLKFMIDELHARGIAVILDVVWNHFDSTDNFLWNFDSTQVYFDNPAVNTPWGAQANYDNATVRQYFLDAVDHNLGEFRFDGFRFDAIFETVRATQATSGTQLIRSVMDRIHRRFADGHALGEIYDNNPWNTSTAGLDMDGQYHERFKNAIGDAISAAASGDPDMSRLASSIPGSGTNVEGTKVFNYFELHDDAWPLNNTARTPRDIDTTAPYDDRYAKARSKLGNGLTLLARGMPAILMGTEWLESNGWEAQKIDWSKKITYNGIFRFYKDLIALRTTDPALFASAPARVFHVNESGNVIAFDRTLAGGNSYVVVANFSNLDYTQYIIGLPRAGRWRVVMSSEDALYQGVGTGSTPATCLRTINRARDGFAQHTTISLPGASLIVLRADPALCPADLDCSSTVDVPDIFTFLSLYFANDAAADFDASGALDVADIFAYLSRWFAGC